MAKLPKQSTKKNPKKLTLERQLLLVKLLKEMLESGFTIQESLAFIGTVNPVMQPLTQALNQHLAAGHLLYSGLRWIGFPADIVSQIRLAEIHGDFLGSLRYITSYLTELQKQKKLFRKVISYPLLLLCFLIVMLLGMKYILLPHLESLTSENGQTNWGFLFIKYAPQVLLGLVLGGVLSSLGLRYYLRKKPALWRGNFYMRVPLVAVVYQKYVTSQFCREWGILLQQGLEMQVIVALLQVDGVAPLIKAVAQTFEVGLEEGTPLDQQVAVHRFFDANLAQVLRQGEVKGKLGQELVLYSQLVWQDFIEKVEKWLNLIQPVLFLCIAVLIISIYGSILLPIYSQGDML